jgi:hypothetical protein
MNFELGWKWEKARFAPHVYADYAYASGDRHPKDGQTNTFDQIYPSNHSLYGIIDLFGWQNLRDEKAVLELSPLKKLTLATGFHELNLASANDAIYNGPGNAVARKPGAYGTHLGEEWEGTANWAVKKYLVSGTGYGHLFPGDVIKSGTKGGSSYNIAYLFVTYAF